MRLLSFAAVAGISSKVTWRVMSTQSCNRFEWQRRSLPPPLHNTPSSPACPPLPPCHPAWHCSLRLWRTWLPNAAPCWRTSSSVLMYRLYICMYKELKCKLDCNSGFPGIAGQAAQRRLISVIPHWRKQLVASVSTNCWDSSGELSEYVH